MDDVLAQLPFVNNLIVCVAVEMFCAHVSNNDAEITTYLFNSTQ